MYRPRRSLVLSCLLTLLAAGALRAQAPEPAALQAAIAAARLEPARAVALKNVKLAVGLGTLRLDGGVLIPATPVGGKTVEMVFLGKGRLEIEPPDAIEGGQLELFTGGSRLDAEFKQAVLVVGQDAAVAAMLRKPAAQPDAGQVRQAEALYADWRKKGEWKTLNAERGILLNALRDPVAAGYFAAWFRGGDLGDISYCVDPGVREQVTLGHFVPLDATEREKRKILKAITREQSKGRMIGVELEDLGQWDTWLSSPLRTAAGKPAPGAPTFEPKKYTLDVTLEERELRLTGKARIDLQPVIAGSRGVSLTLPGDFQVSKVTDAGGAPLFYLRTGGQLTVVLPQAPPSGGTATVVVEYAGRPVDKDWNLFTLLDTMGWYPHAGAVDRAPYDVTFHWPKGLELVSSGRRLDGGESPGGGHWERRALDLPSFGFSFEVGRFKVETARAGHVQVRFAFGSGTAFTGRGSRDDVIKAVTDSLQFYEEKFGPYPLDELTVTTANRNFSQGMLGFVTLSNGVLNDLGMWNRFFGVEDRRLVVAHEIAHQWWGDQVGWTSYRDQWISEAMASYAALLFGKERLGGNYKGVDLTSGWQRALTSSLPDGRSLESVGPVVLGERLFSSHSANAYEAIVYEKGALILDMLARGLGEESFPKVLKQVVKVSASGTITTEELFTLIEKITGSDLKAFTESVRLRHRPARDPLHLWIREEGGRLGGQGGGPPADAAPLPLQGRPHPPRHLRRRPRGGAADRRPAVHAGGAGRHRGLRPEAGQGQGQGRRQRDRPGEHPGQGGDDRLRDRRRARSQGVLARPPQQGLRPVLRREPPSQADAVLPRPQGGCGRQGRRRPWRSTTRRWRPTSPPGQRRDGVLCGPPVCAAGDERADRARPRPSPARPGEGRGGRRGARQGELSARGRGGVHAPQGAARRAARRLRQGFPAAAEGVEARRRRAGQQRGYALLAISARATGHQEELDKALKKARENGADVGASAGS